jgi:hypothetical protein
MVTRGQGIPEPLEDYYANAFTRDKPIRTIIKSKTAPGQ